MKCCTILEFFSRAQASGISPWQSCDGKLEFSPTRNGDENEQFVRKHGARAGEDWVEVGADREEQLLPPVASPLPDYEERLRVRRSELEADPTKGFVEPSPWDPFW